MNVANVILAELPSGEPRDVAAKAKQAAKDCWEQFANEARTRAGSAIVDAIWKEQIQDVIEFYAAWVEQTDNYTEDRKKLMRLLAGRKNLRNFREQCFNDAGIPKSSLDGQRPSVFVQPQYRSQRDELRATWPKLLRLASGEELDVVGVTKRLGKKRGESHPTYSSVARITAETWLQGKRQHPQFAEFETACGKVPGLNRVAEEAFDYFPFEGTVVFKDRHTDLVDELGLESKSKLEVVARLLKELGGEPNPYLAVLVADGDKMGAAISALGSADDHRAFLQALAGFANYARTIVNDHNGVLVFAGGDDVLAFLPVDKCLACARRLRDKFIECLKTQVPENTPTLSVGIAIGHFMENLEDLLEYGRAAEKAAKKVVDEADPAKTKDALAVHLHKRGGSPVEIAARWETKPDERLARFAELICLEAIPSKLPYDLRKLADHYAEWKQASKDEKQLVKAAMQQDVIRVIRDKQLRSGREHMPEIESVVKAIETPRGLKQFTEHLLVARQIATALKQAEGKS